MPITTKLTAQNALFAGKYEKAIEGYEKAAELTPKDAEVFNCWGLSLSGLANERNDQSLHHESIEKYKRAIELNPNYSNAFFN
jgi:tetratricopeptide (TPR) repeat protein